MKSFTNSKPTQDKNGFTRTDLVASLVGVLLLGITLLPAVGNMRFKGDLPACANNLRQIGVALRQWATDHDDKFPLWTTAENGGTMGISLAWAQFIVLSNQLPTPRILVCPSDHERTAAINFSTNHPGGFGVETNQNRALSYWLGAEGNFNKPRTLLSGDRSAQFVTFGENCAASGAMVRVQKRFYSWNPTKFHYGSGNFLWVDGAVISCNSPSILNNMQPSQDGNLSICAIVP